MSNKHRLGKQTMVYSNSQPLLSNRKTEQLMKTATSNNSKHFKSQKSLKMVTFVTQGLNTSKTNVW